MFNVVPGFGHTAGEALALHMDVDCIAFTGSTRIGRRMLEYAVSELPPEPPVVPGPKLLDLVRQEIQITVSQPSRIAAILWQ